MSKYLITLLSLLLFSSFSFAQSDLDLTSFGSVKELEKEFEDFNNGIYAGMSALDWTDASGPSVFRISAMVFASVGSIPKNTALNISDDIYTPSGLGAQVGIGTMGFEAYVRMLPEVELDGVKYKSLGFGLKYDLTSLIPVPGFPATAIFVDHNTMDFGISKSKQVTVSGQTGDINTGVDLGFVTNNVGLMMSYDLLLVRVFGKVAMEMGTTSTTWNQGVVSNGQVVEEKVSGEIDSNGFKISAGFTAMGIRAEVGTRGGNLFAGLGYGISI